jgi:hypothetical protein
MWQSERHSSGMRHWQGDPTSPHIVILSRRRRICAKIEDAHLGGILRCSQDGRAFGG